jgi:signal transduction histidine kinase
MQQVTPAAASEPAAAFLQAAITIALAGVCYLLYRRYRKFYFLVWTIAWLLYSARLAAIISFLLTDRAIWLYWHQVATGLTALALLWAALAFSQGTRWRPWYAVLAAFPLLWSYVAIYRMDNFMLAAAPAVAFLSIATFWTGFVFLRHYTRARSVASLLLGIALLLWGLHHLDYPFLRARGVWNPYGYYIDILFELAMGAGILLIVGEELHGGLRALSALSVHLQTGGRVLDLPGEMLERAMTLPAVRGAALLLVRPDGPLVVRGAGACAGWEEHELAPEASSVVREAIESRRPVVRGGVRTRGPERFTHAYIAALPVLSRDSVRGALVMVSPARDPFAALDEDFLLALGRQFGAALENTELYQGLTARTADLERLAARMVHQHEEERRRLSRELHDETAQVFAAINMQLGLLREQAVPGEAPRLDRALSLVGDGIRTIRAVTDRLRPPLLDDLGLLPALRGLIDEFVEHHAVEVRFDSPAGLPGLSRDAELALFRALQEALSNVARHAAASRVDVRIRQDGRNLSLEVADDGRGFHTDAHADDTSRSVLAGGMGLEGMRERVSLLGGQLAVHDRNGNGVVLTVTLPAGNGDSE